MTVQYVGKIDRRIYATVAADILTPEVIITEERVEHIRERHPGDYERIAPFLQEAVEEPDYILADKALRTALVLKRVVKNGRRVQVVLRLHTPADTQGFKNSIISAWEISEARWENYLRNKTVLYKRE